MVKFSRVLVCLTETVQSLILKRSAIRHQNNLVQLNCENLLSRLYDELDFNEVLEDI